ncbi:hypothetical protein BV898_02218 [Hypsibius exemplaris]|uniref:Exosome complex component CSL4 n=1 Tax=Hypsibius exemplaris TaxID=2072580 RepID=A0A1W0X8L2_HYPEX|nr:hypothetical protein BV898_02218 [Hypsibius exemplaris]
MAVSPSQQEQPQKSFHKISIPKAGKVFVYSGKSVAPGEVLAICGASVKGRAGVWTENRRIRSAYLGTVTVQPRHNENDHRIEISVTRPKCPHALHINTTLPKSGDIVIAEVTAVDVLEVQCVIRTVAGENLEEPINAVLRMEHIEPLNPHLIELEDYFAVRDLLLARVVTLDSPVQLDVTGDAKLGVVMSWSAADCLMVPIGPHEVICPETFRKSRKRLSTAVAPVTLPPRK